MGVRDLKNEHVEICNQLINLFCKKNADYGNSFDISYDTWGMISALIRLDDKMNRLKALVHNTEQQVKDESIRDTLLDLANYAIMTIKRVDLKAQDTISTEKSK